MDIQSFFSEFLKKQFPLLAFIIWETRAFNEFANHQMARNFIFIESVLRRRNHFCAAAHVRSACVETTEQVRGAVSNIEKRHFKFVFTSTLTGREQAILLDILFEENPYSTTIEKSIENELLLIEPPAVTVRLPNVNCILADKLTAFAPYTSGITYNVDKEMEIIKQLYDIAALVGYIDDFAEVKSIYHDIVKIELMYRGMDAGAEDALLDAIQTAACVAGRGQYHPEEYPLLQRGITNIRNHIYSENFNGEVAVQRACAVMCLAAAILTSQDGMPVFKEDSYYAAADIRSDEFKKLGYIKKMDLFAYKHLVEAVEMLIE